MIKCYKLMNGETIVASEVTNDVNYYGIEFPVTLDIYAQMTGDIGLSVDKFCKFDMTNKVHMIDRGHIIITYPASESLIKFYEKVKDNIKHKYDPLIIQLMDSYKGEQESSETEIDELEEIFTRTLH